jgi:hypothetical protein
MNDLEKRKAEALAEFDVVWQWRNGDLEYQPDLAAHYFARHHETIRSALQPAQSVRQDTSICKKTLDTVMTWLENELFCDDIVDRFGDTQESRAENISAVIQHCLDGLPLPAPPIGGKS